MLLSNLILAKHGLKQLENEGIEEIVKLSNLILAKHGLKLKGVITGFADLNVLSNLILAKHGLKLQVGALVGVVDRFFQT